MELRPSPWQSTDRSKRLCRLRDLEQKPQVFGLSAHFKIGLGSSALTFPGRLRLDGECMDGALEFRVKRRVYHAVAFNAALPFEGRRHNINPEMRLASRPVAGVALMQMRFVRDVEAFRQESFTQLVYDNVPGAHDGGR
ncbi:hypothetical protein V1278_000282 [Bradyrhizobium sp. AZCC 1577]